jgi:hypothetical protein
LEEEWCHGIVHGARAYLDWRRSGRLDGEGN